MDARFIDHEKERVLAVIDRLVVLTTVKFVLERVESETLGVALRIPRKRIIAKAREVLMELNKAI